MRIAAPMASTIQAPDAVTDDATYDDGGMFEEDLMPATRLPATMGVAPALLSLLDELSTTGAARATEVEDLFDTDTSLRRRLELIDGAEHTLTFSYYCISADPVGMQIFDKLIAAAKRGVKVVGNVSWITQQVGNRFVLDGANAETYAAYEAKVKELETAGGLLTYHATPIDFLENFGAGNHFKALVADSKVAIVGGRNIVGFEFDPKKPMLDQDMLLRGPIAAKIDAAMLRILSRAHLSPFDFDSDASVRRFARLREAVAAQVEKAEAAAVQSPPKATDPQVWPIIWDPTYDVRANGTKHNPITQAYVALIDNAHEEVLITGNYFNDSGAITDAVLRAAKRGVKVKIVTWGEANSTGPAELLYMRSTALYARLHAAGVEIYETDTPQHAKSILIDGKLGAWGSYNCDLPGENTLIEGTFVTNDAIILMKLRWAQNFIMSQCDKLTDARAEALAKRHWPWWKRLAAATIGRVI